LETNEPGVGVDGGPQILGAELKQGDVSPFQNCNDSDRAAATKPNAGIALPGSAGDGKNTAQVSGNRHRKRIGCGFSAARR
jgi:hypothetical protein